MACKYLRHFSRVLVFFKHQNKGNGHLYNFLNWYLSAIKFWRRKPLILTLFHLILSNVFGTMSWCLASSVQILSIWVLSSFRSCVKVLYFKVFIHYLHYLFSQEYLSLLSFQMIEKVPNPHVPTSQGRDTAPAHSEESRMEGFRLPISVAVSSHGVVSSQISPHQTSPEGTWSGHDQ